MSRAYYPVVSIIDSRTTSTSANTTVLGYDALSVISRSNIVLEESMMQVSFGLTTITNNSWYAKKPNQTKSLSPPPSLLPSRLRL